MDRIRVLQILPAFQLGGAEQMATHLMCNLDRDRFMIQAISLNDPVKTELERTLVDAQIPVYFLGKRSGPDPRMLYAIDRLLREIRPHIVHTHQYVLRYAFLPAFWRKVPVRLHTIHTIANLQHGKVGRVVNLVAFRGGVTPVAIAHEIRTSICQTYRIDNIPVIPNGIPVASYSTPQVGRSIWREREGFPDHATLFVSVARLYQAKNPRMLIRAFAAIDPLSSNAHLLMVGDGILRPNLEHVVRRLGIESCVHFLGLRNDIRNILGAADIFVLASNREGNPLSVMEAMAAGKPVIGTNVGGMSELVDNGRTGVLVRAGDEHALSDAMRRLLDSPPERRAMGEEGAREAKARFDVSVMTKSYEVLYENMLEESI